MKIFRFLSCALLGALASTQAAVLNADNPTIQLSGNGLWQVEAVKNAALMNSLTGKEKACLNDKIYESRHILGYLRRSSALSHRIEGHLMNIFPRHIGSIYTLLDRMKH